MILDDLHYAVFLVTIRWISLTLIMLNGEGVKLPLATFLLPLRKR